ncbi:putative transposase IS66 [Magnetofaba australis IT-1]|uniref:Putative transposase IS66 n=1 Tax=Magnetofaba australis IT-1 TaxID=1434232 RepID=A0A1Y2K7P7_9PROT|nr:putative transposase IS66 [Magnetofaba australis IT-1]
MDKLLNDLPESPEELREMLAVLLKERDSLQQQVGSLQQRADSLQEQVNLLKAWRFGRRSEKFSDHPSLFDEAEIEAQAAPDADIADEDGADETVAVAGHERSKGGRKPLPAHLPRREIIHDLPAEQKTCGVDGHALVEIGRDVSEQLEIIPAQVTVIRHVRLKYGCPHCHSGVVRANMPPQPIPKALATASMLAFVAVSKYADALPLYRQHTILARSGIDLPRSTLANWMIRCGQLVQPLINLLRDRMLEGGVIQMDETPVQVLREDGKPASSKSYMWVQRGGPPGGAVILFDYDATRQGRVPKELLADYKGWLQTDGYSGYLAMGKVAGIEHVGCWAHARRLFSDAAKAAGGKKSAKADYAIKLIGKLYAIEKRVRDKPPEERYAARQSEAPPILAKLREWLDKWLPEAVPIHGAGQGVGLSVRAVAASDPLHRGWAFGDRQQSVRERHSSLYPGPQELAFLQHGAWREGVGQSLRPDRDRQGQRPGAIHLSAASVREDTGGADRSGFRGAAALEPQSRHDPEGQAYPLTRFTGRLLNIQPLSVGIRLQRSARPLAGANVLKPIPLPLRQLCRHGFLRYASWKA